VQNRGVRWSAHEKGDTAGWPIPRPVATVLDSTALRGGLRVAARLLSTAGGVTRWPIDRWALGIPAPT
jgi:hypothetical protein